MARQELHRHDLKKQKWTTRGTWGDPQIVVLDLGREKHDEQASLQADTSPEGFPR
jgi:hypothetical protein